MQRQLQKKQRRETNWGITPVEEEQHQDPHQTVTAAGQMGAPHVEQMMGVFAGENVVISHYSQLLLVGPHLPVTAPGPTVAPVGVDGMVPLAGQYAVEIVIAVGPTLTLVVEEMALCAGQHVAEVVQARLPLLLAQLLQLLQHLLEVVLIALQQETSQLHMVTEWTCLMVVGLCTAMVGPRPRQHSIYLVER